MKDLEINKILNLELQMTNKSLSNNCRSEGSGVQKFEVTMLRALAESTKIFAQLLGVFAQSSYFLAQLIEVSV